MDLGIMTGHLENTSGEIMHIVSEINGLYAGAKDNGSGIYSGLTTQTRLDAIADLETDKKGSSVGIKTALPNIDILIAGINYDPATKTSDDNGPANNFLFFL